MVSCNSPTCSCNTRSGEPYPNPKRDPWAVYDAIYGVRRGVMHIYRHMRIPSSSRYTHPLCGLPSIKSHKSRCYTSICIACRRAWQAQDTVIRLVGRWEAS